MKVKKLSHFINEQSGSDYDEGQIFAGDESRIISPINPVDPKKPPKKSKKILPFSPFRKDDDSSLTKSFSKLDKALNTPESAYEENDNEINLLYHSIEEENYDSVMKDGLRGEIYLTRTADEARQYHPVVLKINIEGRKLKIRDEGYIVKDVPVDQIEPVIRKRGNHKDRYYGGKIKY